MLGKPKSWKNNNRCCAKLVGRWQRSRSTPKWNGSPTWTLKVQFHHFLIRLVYEIHHSFLTGVDHHPKGVPAFLYMVESGNDFQGWTYWKLIFQTSIFGSPAINLAGNRFLFSPSLGMSYFGEFENFVLVRHILYMFTFTRRVDRLCLEHSLEKSLVWTASLLRKGYCIYASM